MGRELRILLVEDEVITSFIVKKNLEKADYRVARSVVTGEDAISAVREMPIDIVLMDIRLAGAMDGIEAASRIQQIRKTPIIFCTGYDDPETRDRANALEPLAFFNKPLDIPAVVSILEGMSPLPNP
jgi:CheY-like chemotaxis protein